MRRPTVGRGHRKLYVFAAAVLCAVIATPALLVSQAVAPSAGAQALLFTGEAAPPSAGAVSAAVSGHASGLPAGTTPLTAVRPGSAEVQDIQRRTEAELAVRQAAAIAPRGSRGEVAAIPVVHAMQPKSASSRAVLPQPQMAAAAAESPARAARSTRSASPALLAAPASAAGTPDTALNNMWNSYGNNAGCADWSGGDATNSIALGDGTVAWFFSDTYLGSPAARKTLFYRSTLHNSIVIQQPRAASLITITGGNTCQEKNTSIPFSDRYAKTPATAPDAGGFYWTGDQTIVGSNVVKFYYHGNHSKFPFAIDSWAVATIPVSALQSGGNSLLGYGHTLTITPTQYNNLCPSAPGSPIIWGSALLNWQGSYYVYGWSTANNRVLYLAKTSAANLTDPSTWQTFAGLNSSGNPVWTNCGADISPLPISLGSGLSVTTIPGSSSLWLIQEDPGSGLVSGPITAHPAAKPWLFTNQETVLYYPPEETHSYPYYYLTYEARLQPAFTSASSVVISYNVNTTAVDTGCVSANAHDASIYRPRFIDVPTSAFSTASLTTEAASPPVGGLAAPSYGIQDDGPTNPGTAPPTNPAGTVLASAAGTGPSIDGATDWYDQWGPLDGGCPSYHAPATLTVSPATPAGEATLTWPTVGTDVWYWGYQADKTAGTGFARTWGGLWAEPASTTATTVSNLVAPVTSAKANGDTYAWYVQPFGAGGTFIGPVTLASPTASEAVTIQRPATPADLRGSSGPAESQFNLGWNDPNYPSSAVYYWMFFWDITAGQTEQQALAGSGGPGCGDLYETCAGAFPDPAPPGSTKYDIAGWTPDNHMILTPDHMYGFVMETENLGGFSIPSIPASVTPTPVCWAGGITAGGSGEIKFNGGPIVYTYFGEESAYPSAGGDILVLKNQGTGQTQQLAILPAPSIGVLQWEIGADPPISWDLQWAEHGNHDLYGTATSTSC